MKKEKKKRGLLCLFSVNVVVTNKDEIMCMCLNQTQAETRNARVSEKGELCQLCECSNVAKTESKLTRADS